MQEKYNVTGMTCAACQARVQKSVSNLTGVQECNVNLLKNSIQSYCSKTPKYSKRHSCLEALPGWRNGQHTLWRTVSDDYRWKRVYGNI